MNIVQLQQYLAQHGVPDDFYAIDELGMGEIHGIMQRNNEWYTYFSERGERRCIQQWESQEQAVTHVLECTVALAKEQGVWVD